MTAMTKIEPLQPTAVMQRPSDATAILSMLERVAADPAQSVERLEQMFGLYQKVEAENSRKKFMSAFAMAQSEMGPIVKDANNPQTKSKYATHSALDAVLRPIYAKHGFAVSFDTTDSPLAEHVRVLGHLIHKDGHERRYQNDMPADGKGAKGGDVMTKTHAAGAAMSYGKRYLLIGIWNLALIDKDTDGNRPIDTGPISEAQFKEIADLIRVTETDLDKFLAIGGLESLSDMPSNQFLKAKALLQAKQRKAQS